MRGATRDPDLEGIAVVMPLAPENGTAYYMKVREIVAASEKAMSPQHLVKQLL